MVGSLGGVGTLLTQAVLGGKAADPATAKKRRGPLPLLDALADGAQRPPAPETDIATAPAPIERA